MKSPKFIQPAFFPSGTVATIKIGRDEPFDIVVKGVSKNGFDSFVVMRDMPELQPGEEYRNDCFNTSYVTAIVKRGDGEVNFMKQGPFEKLTRDVSKGKVSAYQIGSVIADYVAQHYSNVDTNFSFDGNAARKAVGNYVIPGKCDFDKIKIASVQKYIKRNFNKFLRTKKYCQAVEDRLDEIDMSREESYGGNSVEFMQKDLFDDLGLDVYDPGVRGCLTEKELSGLTKRNIPVYRMAAANTKTQEVVYWYSDVKDFGVASVNRYEDWSVTVKQFTPDIESVANDGYRHGVTTECLYGNYILVQWLNQSPGLKSQACDEP